MVAKISRKPQLVTKFSKYHPCPERRMAREKRKTMFSALVLFPRRPQTEMLEGKGKTPKRLKWNG
jgi:hypothetical protein